MRQETKRALSDMTSMWAAVEAARLESCGATVARPANSFTVREFAQRYGKSESHAAALLNKMAREGRLAKTRAYVPDATGRNMPTFCYSPKGQG